MIQTISDNTFKKFNLRKTLTCHELPLTNCAFNKNGDKFITGSYDQTCIIWDTKSGELLHKLVGHKNVVYTFSFNLPYTDKVATGHSIKPQSYGMSIMENAYQHLEVIQLR